ncbi:MULTISPECIES: AMP-binding protein [Pseudomonas]|nr:AMP-binding protein [Pseudomonas marginalis]
MTDQPRPERKVLVCGDRETTASQLDLHATRVANGLWDFGLEDRERIAILDHHSDQFYEIWLGAARTNLVLTPLSIHLSASEVAQVLVDCGPRVLFIGADFEELLSQIRPQLTFVEQIITTGDAYVAWRDEQSTVAAKPTMKASDDCLQVYTCDSTDLPKGVQLTSDSIFKAPLAALLAGEISPYRDIGPDDIVLLCLPNGHIAGSILGALGLAVGARLVVIHDFVPSQIVALIERERVTLSIMVPAMIRSLVAELKQSGRTCASLNTRIYSAAPMATSVLIKTMEKLPYSRFGQIYGLMQTSGPISA